MNSAMFFDGCGSVIRTAVVGMAAYAALVAILPLLGKRTLGKMNAFDLVVAVALGSTLATILLSNQVSLAAGVTALGVLVGMQCVVTWLSVRSSSIRRAVRSEPRLLVLRGRMLEQAIKDEPVSREEVLAALRGAGVAGPAGVAAVILDGREFQRHPLGSAGCSGARVDPGLPRGARSSSRQRLARRSLTAEDELSRQEMRTSFSCVSRLRKQPREQQGALAGRPEGS